MHQHHRIFLKQARSLDDSLNAIIKLESAVAGGGKGAVAYKEQLSGKEKLQVRSLQESCHRDFPRS